MTEPDEALLWAREQLANTWRKDGAPPKAVAAALAGEFDDVLGLAAHDYRAGAAASAERIKALEAALGHFLGSYCDTAFWDVENEPEVIAARALLKEPDQ